MNYKRSNALSSRQQSLPPISKSIKMPNTAQNTEGPNSQMIRQRVFSIRNKSQDKSPVSIALVDIKMGRIPTKAASQKQKFKIPHSNPIGIQQTSRGSIPLQHSNLYDSTTCMPYSITKEQADKSLLLHEYGKKLFQIGKIDQAIRGFNDSISQNPLNMDSRYMLGVCLFNKSIYDQCVRELGIVADRSPKLNKNMYILLAMCYKKQGLIQLAIQQVLNKSKKLEKGLYCFEKFYDGLIFKGKLQVKSNDIESAERTFNMAIQQNPDRPDAFTQLGNICKIQGNLVEAEFNFQQAVDLSQNQMKLIKNLHKLAIVQFDSHQYKKADETVERLLIDDPYNSDALYLRGLIKQRLGQPEQSLLLFEQAIQHNKSSLAVTKSIIEICKQQIQRRDFYSASHTMSRFEYIDKEDDSIQIYSIFSEAVINLMKRQYAEAQEKFVNLFQLNIPKQLMLSVKTYRAYCLFCNSQYEESQQDYEYVLEHNNNEFNNDGLLYNSYLSRALALIQNKSDNYDEMLLNIEKAQAIQFIDGDKPEPELYKTIIWVKTALNQEDEQQKSQFMIKALSAATLAHSIAPQQHVPLYFRSMIQGYLNQTLQSLYDIEQAIEKCDDNKIQHFYLKGVLLAMAGEHMDAINIFTVCLDMDDMHSDSYLYRSKCFLALNRLEEAFDDMEKFVRANEKDIFIEETKNLPKNIPLQTGNLLLYTGAYDEALKAYQQTQVFLSNPQFVLNMAKCHFAMYRFTECLQQLKKGQSIDYETDISAIDQLVAMINIDNIDSTKFTNVALTFSDLIISKKEGLIITSEYYHIYRALACFQSSRFELALQEFEKVVSQYEKPQDEQQGIINLVDRFCKFNIILCWMMMKKYKYAIRQLESVQPLFTDSNSSKVIKSLLLILENEVKNQNTLFMIQPVSTFQQFTKRSKLIEPLTILNIHQGKEFYFMLPPIVAQSPTLGEKYLIFLANDIPSVSPPDFKPHFDEEIIRNIKFEEVENQPEAPWIKRNTDGVIFTDDVQNFSQLNLESEEETKNN